MAPKDYSSVDANDRRGLDMSILLAQAKTIIEASIAKGRDLGLKPLSVVVLDERASLVACMSEDGVSQMRAKIAHGKANAAIALGMGTRALMNRAEQQACYWVRLAFREIRQTMMRRQHWLALRRQI
jgi:uncharacterized protein GlcG (DUF336 family)